MRRLALNHQVLCGPDRRSARARAARGRDARVRRHRDRSPAPRAVELRRRCASRYEAAARERHDAIAGAIRGAGAEHLVLVTDRDWLIDIVRFVAGRRATRRSAAAAARTRRCRDRSHLHAVGVGTEECSVSFAAPWRLLLIVAPLVLLVAYIIVQRSRRKYALRFTSVDLLASVAPRRPGWQRHVSAVLMLVAVLALVVGFARPTAYGARRRSSAARSCSRSTRRDRWRRPMSRPSRLGGRGSAARRFVEKLPPGLKVGLLSFDTSASVLVVADLGSRAGARRGRTASGRRRHRDRATRSTSRSPRSPRCRRDADGKKAPAAVVLMSDGIADDRRERPVAGADRRSRPPRPRSRPACRSTRSRSVRSNGTIADPGRDRAGAGRPADDGADRVGQRRQVVHRHERRTSSTRCTTRSARASATTPCTATSPSGSPASGSSC